MTFDQAFVLTIVGLLGVAIFAVIIMEIKDAMNGQGTGHVVGVLLTASVILAIATVVWIVGNII